MSKVFGTGAFPSKLLSSQRQTSGTSLSYVIPGGTLAQAGDSLKIWAVSNNGTSGNVTMTISVGGATIGSIVGGPNSNILWEVTIIYVTDTTAVTSWSWESAAGTPGANDCDFTNPLTVSSWASDSTFSMVITNGTSPDMEAMTVTLFEAP